MMKPITQLNPVTVQTNKAGKPENIVYHMKGSGSAVVWSIKYKRWLYVAEEGSEFMRIEEVRILFNNIRDSVIKMAQDRHWTNIKEESFFGTKA